MEDTTAEYSASELLPAIPLQSLASVSIGAKTDLGRVRENNEDKFEFLISSDEAVLASRGQVFVVCDGMGGHAAGQIASELAAKTFIDVYLSHPGQDVKDALVSALNAANRYVFLVSQSVPSRRGMGTTFTGLILVQDQAYVVQVGDSRMYRLRGEVLTQITHDHTYMDEMIRNGVLTPEQASVHPQKHVLTRAVGVEEQVLCDVFQFTIEEGDTYFLCSDGILNHVQDAEILSILLNNGPGAAAWKLVGQALVGGGSDNATALVLKVDKLKTFGSSENN
jgi:PPM family protein phosphatase